SEQMRLSLLNFMLSFAEQNYKTLEQNKPSWKRCLIKLGRADISDIFQEIQSCFSKDEFAEHKQKLRLFYVYTLLTKLRMEGKLEPWESIIIVREREE
ncbi:hypothetical protein, partial [Candidatus Albibeggiatoa sp. nov. BB20]|uniref:hypothetical protein n=1 Tax=Candidatus Albibeggiatoa sp. nov. BB20 TaxID=3162723 RepID=UPI0033654A4E